MPYLSEQLALLDEPSGIMPPIDTPDQLVHYKEEFDLNTPYAPTESDT